jgi:hypothetical protein
VPGASQPGTWPTKHSLLTTNYEPKSPSRRAGDRSDEKIVIVRGAQKLPRHPVDCVIASPRQVESRRLSFLPISPRRALALLGHRIGIFDFHSRVVGFQWICGLRSPRRWFCVAGASISCPEEQFSF